MIKYFHELTKEEYSELCKRKPPLTYGDLAKDYARPKWCSYPDATDGLMGCWSLMSFLVTSADDCKECESYSPQKEGE